MYITRNPSHAKGMFWIHAILVQDFYKPVRLWAQFFSIYDKISCRNNTFFFRRVTTGMDSVSEENDGRRDCI
jgi:hypothetical protein